VPGRARASPRRAIVVLALAGVAYTLAAWTTAPGFYDGSSADCAADWNRMAWRVRQIVRWRRDHRAEDFEVSKAAIRCLR
jgi:hypothetical protein